MGGDRANSLHDEWRWLRVELAELPSVPGEVGPVERELRRRLDAIERSLGPSEYLQLEETLRAQYRALGRGLPPLEAAATGHAPYALRRWYRIGSGLLLIVVGLIMFMLKVALSMTHYPRASVIVAGLSGGLIVAGILVILRAQWWHRQRNLIGTIPQDRLPSERH